jgi:hypothetical protein
MLSSAMVLGWFAPLGAQLYDGGELVAAASELGGSHPPGQPLHAIAGYAASLVPIGTIGFRVSLLSVVCAVLAAWVGAKLVERSIAELPRSTVTALAPEAAGVAIVLAPSLLRQANRAEVYSLALLLALGALYALVARARLRGIASAFFLAGLAAAVHPPHAIVVLGFALVFAAIERRAFRSMLVTPVFAILGGAVYAYLPVRTLAGAPMWGRPETWSGFFDYVTASAYRMNLGAAELEAGEVALEAVRTFTDAAGYVAIGGLVLWLSFAARERRDVLLGGALAFAIVPSLVTPLSRANPDTVAYAGPFAAIAIVLGCTGVAHAHDRLMTRGPRTALAVIAIALLAVIAMHVESLEAFARRIHTDNPALDAYAMGALDAPPARALAAVETDFMGASWLMERATAEARPDAALFITGLGTSSWHWRSLAGHPRYDGTPRRSDGADAHAQYARGALEIALGEVPIAAEADALVERNGAVSGAYLVLPAGGVPTTGPVDGEGLGELFAPAIEALTAGAPRGDGDGAIDTLRALHLARAERLFVRGRFDAAQRALRAALLDRPERTFLSAGWTTQVRPLAPFVRERPPLGRSAGDAVRAAAVFFFAAGQSERAFEILARAFAAGDARALLQTAWLRLVDGDVAAARGALATFRARAPELTAESLELEGALGGAP